MPISRPKGTVLAFSNLIDLVWKGDRLLRTIYQDPPPPKKVLDPHTILINDPENVLVLARVTF